MHVMLVIICFALSLMACGATYLHVVIIKLIGFSLSYYSTSETLADFDKQLHFRNDVKVPKSVKSCCRQSQKMDILLML